MAIEETARNQELIALCNEGKYTMQQLGDRFGISRERVRQIYKSKTGNPFRKRIILNQITKWEKAIEKEKNRGWDGICLSCRKEFRKSTRKKELCDDCDAGNTPGCGKGVRNYKIRVTCTGCGIEYAPFRNFKYSHGGAVGDFHSVSCYWAYLHRIGKTPRNVLEKS